MNAVCHGDELLSDTETAARSWASSSRVDIAPRRGRHATALGRPETARRLPTRAVNADRYRLVGHYTTPRAERYGDAAERQNVIKGRARVTDRSSRHSVHLVLLRTVRSLRTSHGRATGLRRHHRRLIALQSTRDPKHKTS